jgi:hypothetical protein
MISGTGTTATGVSESQAAVRVRPDKPSRAGFAIAAFAVLATLLAVVSFDDYNLRRRYDDLDADYRKILVTTSRVQTTDEAKASIHELWDLGIIKGRRDGQSEEAVVHDGMAPVTKGELALIFHRLLKKKGLELRPDVPVRTQGPDESGNTADELNHAAATLAAYQVGTLQPDDPSTADKTVTVGEYVDKWLWSLLHLRLTTEDTNQKTRIKSKMGSARAEYPDLFYNQESWDNSDGELRRIDVWISIHRCLQR